MHSLWTVLKYNVIIIYWVLSFVYQNAQGICERILFVHLFAINWRPLDFQAEVCARVQTERERMAGCLGTGRLGSLDSLGRSISFRALSTAEFLVAVFFR